MAAGRKKVPKTYTERYVKTLLCQEKAAWKACKCAHDNWTEEIKKNRELQKANDVYHAHLRFMFEKAIECCRKGYTVNSEWLLKEIPKLMHQAGRMEL